MKNLSTFTTGGFFRFARRTALLLALGAAGPAAWGQSFGPMNLYSTGGTRSLPQCVALGDMNGDGRLDIVAGSYSDNAVAVLLGQASGFASVNTVATGSATPTSVAVGDTNGDGRLDIVTGSYGNAVALLQGVAGGGFAPVTTVSAANQGQIVLGDVNGDGRLDIIRNGFGTASILLGLTTGGFSPVTTYSTGGGTNGAIALGDVNSDGRLDMVVTNSNEARVLLGQSIGFAAVSAYPIGTNSGIAHVAVGDVNGDGRLDIVTANSDSGDVGVILGQPNTGFGSASFYASGPTGIYNRPSRVALGDVNGDGRLDIVVINRTGGNLSNTIGVLLGQATGFSPVVAYPISTANEASDVALGDMNGDGRLDIVVANYISNNVGVLLNTGTYTPLATARLTAAAEITLAPNPAHEAFRVQLPAGFAPTSAELLNALGQVVRRSAVGGSSFQVETSGLAPGLYTLRLLAGGTALARRVVVE